MVAGAMKPHKEEVAPCLILTATVQVRDNMAFVQRRDISTRLADYRGAFKRWIQTPEASPVIFVENSGFDLSEFEDIAAEVPNKQVELLSFRCPPFDGSLGKGYGEMLCLQYCLAHSKVLRESPRFLKVTGRYYLANAPMILNYLRLHREIDVACKLERNLTWADSRAFGGATEFLRNYFCPMLDQIDDTNGSAFEHVLARACHRVMADRGQWGPLPEALQIHGVSGSIGDVFTPSSYRSFKEKIKHNLYLRSLK
jgi:hypothetical protein